MTDMVLVAEFSLKAVTEELGRKHILGSKGKESTSSRVLWSNFKRFTHGLEVSPLSSLMRMYSKEAGNFTGA